MFFPILGEIRWKCFSLWTKWMREKLSIPCLRRSKYISSFFHFFFLKFYRKIIFSQKILHISWNFSCNAAACGHFLFFLRIFNVTQYHNILLTLQLWPLFGGTMTKPEKGKLFYVPQVTVIFSYNNLHLHVSVLSYVLKRIQGVWQLNLVYFSDPIWR